MQSCWKNSLRALTVLLLLAAHAGAAWGLAGKVQFVIGDVRLINAAGQTKALQKGAEINEGDRVVTANGASAQIKMVDGGFIAVRPNTDMGFDTYRYSGRENGTENAILSLVQGGFRTITGIIGRTNKQNYLVKTATATIGIRGTDHEPMVILAPRPGQAAIAPPGTYDKVNVGIAFIRNEAGTVDIQRNQVGYAPDTKAPPRVLPSIPPFYRPTPAPGPQKTKEEAKEDGKKETAQTAATAPAKSGEEQKAAAPAEKAAEAPAPIRNTAVVDPTSTVTTSAAATTVASVPAVVAPVVAITATDASGSTVDATNQTLTSPSGATVPILEGVFAAQAQAAADAALAAANAAQTAATAAVQADATLAAVGQVSTTPASTAITAANDAISTASPSVTSATALTPANAATATANAAAAQTAASTAASQASAAASALAANGAFADVTAAPANNSTQSANSAIIAANTSVQTAAATTLPAQNTALTDAQNAATTALTSAGTSVTAANGSLTAATTQNTAIVTAQSAATGLAAQAQAAVTAAQTAATAANAAATQAAALQAAGDFTGAAAQLASAQQQQTIAQQQQAIAQNANTALANQLAAAQAAQTAASTAVTNATTTSNNAATLAATATTQASAAQTAAANAAAALAETIAATTGTQANTVQTQAGIVAANAPIAAYNNPAVVTTNRFVGMMDTVTPVTGGFVDGFGPGAGFSGVGQANTSFVLDGAGNLVEGRHMWYEETPASSSVPQVLVADANIKRTAGTSVETFKLSDNSIYGGRWQGGTITVSDNAVINPVATFSRSLGLTSEHWAIMLAPPTGYAQTLTGTAAYTKVAATSPTDALGNVGVLNTASLTANFTDQLVSAGVNLTIAGKTLDVAAPNMPIHGSNFSTGTGVTAACTGCASTYFANVGGGFAGDAAASAALNYMLWTGAAPGATSPASDLIHGLAAFLTATAPTVQTGGPFAAYAPSDIAIEFATPFFSSQENSMAAPADLVFVDGGLSSFTDRDIGDGGSNSFSVIGGNAPVTANATNFATTGVQFGRWSSATALQASFTNSLGAQSGAPTTWIYGPQGYLDTPVVFGGNTGPLTGTFNYALDGSTAPYDRQSGTSGTLTNASVSADFTNQTASASVALTVGGQAWSAATVNPVSFGNSNQFFASSSPGGVSNNLTVSMGAGTPAACPTCFGSLAGAFTGQNYAGAILSYNLSDSGNAGGDIVGHAALARTGAAIANGTPAATGQYFVGDFGGNLQTVDTLSTPGGVLTSYGSGTNFFSSTTVTCTTCTVTAATNAATPAAPTGVFFGTWDAGSFTNTFGGSFSGGNPHWITGPEPGPVFLANALIGTKSFGFDGGMATNSAGVTGTVLGTTALAVDFTKQVVGINLDLSINDTTATPTPHTWNAKTLPGNEAVLNSGKGLGGAGFHASSFNGTGPGLLTVTVDGTTSGSGNVSGQLTGTGLNGAIMSYDLFATLGGVATPTFEQVNGVAAFLGSTSDVATPYRLVMMSATDPFSIIKQPALGFYPNNPTRMLTDVAGNLTQFDMSLINDHGSSKGNGSASQILSSGTSVLTDQGSDPVTDIRWGRWAGGSINVTDRIDGTIKTQPLAGSLHWIAGAAETAAVTLPVSGTFTYVRAGGTAPTDNLGNVGTLNSATLTANFTTQTVDVGVQTTIAGASLGGSASAVPIIQRTAFAAGPDMPAKLSVTCTGACGTTHRGTIIGGFSGAGATGAAMMYSLEKVGGVNASVTSGVVGFRR